MSVSLLGLVNTIQVLRKVEKAVSLIGARSMAAVIVDILAKAQPRVPVDTGKLRESGRAYIRFGTKPYIEIAKGKKDGSVDADLGKITLSSIRNTKTIRTNVVYSRMADKHDFDVAQWTHFNINPQGSGSPEARTPGTGPFYLMIPFDQYQDKYIRFIQDSCVGKKFERSIALASRITQRRTGKYTVNFVDVVLSRIESRGYYG